MVQIQDKPKRSQAERVLRKFKGARRLAVLIRRHPASVYKWTYPRERGGTGGLVPTEAWPAIAAAALVKGVKLTRNDTDPNPR